MVGRGEDEQIMGDKTDTIRTAERYMHLVRCAGGRIIAAGLKCPHCDSYNPDDLKDCRLPKPYMLTRKKELYGRKKKTK